MTLPSRPGAARSAAASDGKPTQINEHKRAEETRTSEHEPHAMAGRRRLQREGREGGHPQ